MVSAADGGGGGRLSRRCAHNERPLPKAKSGHSSDVPVVGCQNRLAAGALVQKRERAAIGFSEDLEGGRLVLELAGP